MCNGRLAVVGMGPGGLEAMTREVYKLLKDADVCIGYHKYIALLPEDLRGLETYDTGMKKEIERCELALELASKGKRVVLVSSGDPGMYAMAGLCFELAKAKNLEDLVQIFPGVSAAQAAAAKLGAPLMHDTAYISLSDLLTPWETIEKRVKLAAEADFVIALYNPRSKGRSEHLKNVIELIKPYKEGNTPIGLVKNAYRENEEIKIETIDTIQYDWVDMFTVVIIGNKETYEWKGKMITPRGYRV
jgi:precorrin-3B C17-methyltransferase